MGREERRGTHSTTLLDAVTEHVVALVLVAAADALAHVLGVAEDVLPVVGLEARLVLLALLVRGADAARGLLRGAHRLDLGPGGLVERVGEQVAEQVERVGEEVAELARREEERHELVKALAGVLDLARRGDRDVRELDVEVGVDVDVLEVGVAGLPDELLERVVAVLLEDEAGDGLEDAALGDDDVAAAVRQLAAADLLGGHAGDVGLEERRREDLADALHELVRGRHLAGLEGAIGLGERRDGEVGLLDAVVAEEGDARERVGHGGRGRADVGEGSEGEVVSAGRGRGRSGGGRRGGEGRRERERAAHLVVVGVRVELRLGVLDSAWKRERCEEEKGKEGQRLRQGRGDASPQGDPSRHFDSHFSHRPSMTAIPFALIAAETLLHCLVGNSTGSSSSNCKSCATLLESTSDCRDARAGYLTSDTTDREEGREGAQEDRRGRGGRRRASSRASVGIDRGCRRG